MVGIRVSSCYRLMKPKVEGACWESRDMLYLNETGGKGRADSGRILAFAYGKM